MSYGYSYFKPQPTQAELRVKVAKAIKPGYKPVSIEGRTIASTWWGRAWCDNIDRYADNYNRLDRGKKYVRANAVIDLDIGEGLVTAKVLGSGRKPYDVVVRIEPLKKDRLDHIIKVCSGKLESLAALESGKFPKEYQQLFTDKEGGLFPSLREIRFSCSCPDLSRLCKHIAAVLYGIGRRLDDNPLIFLTLRGIDVKSFTESVIRKEAGRLWSSSDKKIRAGRVMDEDRAKGLFGYESAPETGVPYGGADCLALPEGAEAGR